MTKINYDSQYMLETMAYIFPYIGTIFRLIGDNLLIELEIKYSYYLLDNVIITFYFTLNMHFYVQ